MEDLHDKYLEKLCQEQVSVAVYLLNGIKLSGLIASFDSTVILLRDNKNVTEQLIYKHAISTIVPHKSI